MTTWPTTGQAIALGMGALFGLWAWWEHFRTTPCRACAATFTDRAAMRRHMRERHGAE